MKAPNAFQRYIDHTLTKNPSSFSGEIGLAVETIAEAQRAIREAVEKDRVGESSPGEHAVVRAMLEAQRAHFEESFLPFGRMLLALSEGLPESEFWPIVHAHNSANAPDEFLQIAIDAAIEEGAE